MSGPKSETPDRSPGFTKSLQNLLQYSRRQPYYGIPEPLEPGLFGPPVFPEDEWVRSTYLLFLERCSHDKSNAAEYLRAI
jgi:hypothetical protein